MIPFQSASHEFIFIYQLIIWYSMLVLRIVVESYHVCHLSSNGNLFDQYRNLKTNSTVSHHCTSRKALREFYYHQHMIWNFGVDSQFKLEYTVVFMKIVY